MPRDNYISIKASQDEKLKLKLEATRLGVSLSDYIRMRALDTLSNVSGPINRHLIDLETAK